MRATGGTTGSIDFCSVRSFTLEDPADRWTCRSGESGCAVKMNPGESEMT
jgi:hypothetical protein